MIHSFRKFFEFAGRQSRNWYLGLLYEIIRCILEALQFAALLVVLDGLVHDNITAQTALLAFGIMLVSVIAPLFSGIWRMEKKAKAATECVRIRGFKLATV